MKKIIAVLVALTLVGMMGSFALAAGIESTWDASTATLSGYVGFGEIVSDAKVMVCVYDANMLYAVKEVSLSGSGVGTNFSFPIEGNLAGFTMKALVWASDAIVPKLCAVEGDAPITENIEGTYKLNAVVVDSYAFSQNVSPGYVTLHLDGDIEDEHGNIIYEEGDLNVKDNTIGADQYLGCAVVAYVGEDTFTGKSILYSISPNSAKNSTVTITADHFEFDSDIFFSDGKITYYDEADRQRTLKIDSEDDIRIVRNGSDDIGRLDVDDLADIPGTFLADGGRAVFLDNDADNEYEYVFFYTVTDNDEFIVESVAQNTVTGENYGDFVYDFENTDSAYAFYKNGKRASFDDIQASCVVSLVRNDGSDAIIATYISDDTVTGTVSSVNQEYPRARYTINGKEYCTSESGRVNINAGDSGVFYLNYFGDIAFFKKNAVDNGSYAFALSLYEDTANDSYTMRMVNTLNKAEERHIASEVEIVHYDAEKERFVTDGKAPSATAIPTYFEIGEAFGTFNPFSAKRTQGLIKCTFDKEGCIDKIFIADNFKGSAVREPVKGATDAFALCRNMLSNTSESTPKTYYKEGNAIGRIKFGDETHLFNITLTDGRVESESDVAVAIPAACFVDGEAYDLVGYDGYGSDGIYKAAVTIKKDTPIVTPDAKSNVFVVSQIVYTSISGNEGVKLVGYCKGAEVTHSLFEKLQEVSYTDATGKAIAFNTKSFNKGQVLLISTAPTGYVNAVQILLDSTSVSADSGIVSFANAAAGIVVEDANNANAVNVYGQFESKNDSRVALYNCDTDDIDCLADYVPSKFNADYKSYETFTPKSSLKKYLVDYTGAKVSVTSTSAPFITTMTTMDEGIKVPRYPQGVYVRYYDNEITDVVVYRFPKIN